MDVHCFNYSQCGCSVRHRRSQDFIPVGFGIAAARSAPAGVRLYARYLCSRDARPSARATIGYLVYKGSRGTASREKFSAFILAGIKYTLMN